MDAQPLRYKINTTSFKNYWEHGSGKALLTKHQLNLDISNATQFIPLLYEVDTQADEIIQSIFSKHSISDGFALIDFYLKTKDLTNFPKNIQDFFQPSLPDWVQHDLLMDGIYLCQRGGLSSFIVLRNYALMGGYESAAINKPLIATGALKRGAIQRLGDTVDFWVNITSETAFKGNQLGIKAILKTRLIHSFSRHQLLSKTNWESEKWGLPINQWDMLATNLGFSLVFLIGLQKLELKPNEQETTGLFHLWKLVGFFIGIPEELLPNTEKDAVEALYYWTMTQTEADDDSIALAHALKDESLQLKSPKNYFARKMMQQTHLAFNEFLLGKYSFDCLKLPTSKFRLAQKMVLIANRRWTKKAFKSTENYHKIRRKGRAIQVKTASEYNLKNR